MIEVLPQKTWIDTNALSLISLKFFLLWCVSVYREASLPSLVVKLIFFSLHASTLYYIHTPPLFFIGMWSRPAAAATHRASKAVANRRRQWSVGCLWEYGDMGAGGWRDGCLDKRQGLFNHSVTDGHLMRMYRDDKSRTRRWPPARL